MIAKTARRKPNYTVPNVVPKTGISALAVPSLHSNAAKRGFPNGSERFQESYSHSRTRLVLEEEEEVQAVFMVTEVFN